MEPTVAVASSPSAAAPHVEVQRFTDFAGFEAFIQRNHHLWSQQVQQALRLIALNGILDPISGSALPASALQLKGSNYRETLEVHGCLARHRALWLLMQELINNGEVPAAAELDLYCPEAITPFAQLLRQRFPRVICSEYLPDPGDPQREHFSHQDLCALTLGDACVDLVLCNELFEHLYDLPAALSEIARILRPGGHLVATFPFAYNRYDTIVKARHRPSAAPGVAAEAELLEEADYHGDPVHPKQGSLVYQIPGWELLDQARKAGLATPTIHWVAAPSYGILGQEIPAVMVLVAGRA
ncbi:MULTISPECIES: class I SAM-dependent methyltransferase [Synechococcales]|uniref:class I SAM-dependent methyltransferase n=1 Tax=Synechococcus sp. CS-1333 TaxID=2848638 RepID=UPI00223A9548|nr:class I SAM-dependent methyltransferase [Synechococcus sp. CS-1333]